MFHPPAADRYRFRHMEKGDVTMITEEEASGYDEDFFKVQRHIHAHAQSTKTRFRTKTRDGILHIKRVE